MWTTFMIIKFWVSDEDFSEFQKQGKRYCLCLQQGNGKLIPVVNLPSDILGLFEKCDLIESISSQITDMYINSKDHF